MTVAMSVAVTTNRHLVGFDSLYRIFFLFQCEHYSLSSPRPFIHPWLNSLNLQASHTKGKNIVPPFREPILIRIPPAQSFDDFMLCFSFFFTFSRKMYKHTQTEVKDGAHRSAEQRSTECAQCGAKWGNKNEENVFSGHYCHWVGNHHVFFPSSSCDLTRKCCCFTKWAF